MRLIYAAHPREQDVFVQTEFAPQQGATKMLTRTIIFGTALFVRTTIALSAVILLGSASAPSAADSNATATALERCVAGLQASGRGFGGDDSLGITEYD